MTPAEVKRRLMLEYLGDERLALDGACDFISQNVASGYVRWPPMKPLAIEPKTHPAAIVIDGEP